MQDHPSRWPKGLLWVLLGIFGVIILFNIYQGLTVQKVGIFGLTVEFGDGVPQGISGVGKVDEVNAQERADRQADLEARVNELQARLEQAEVSQAQDGEATLPPVLENSPQAGGGNIFEGLLSSGQVELDRPATDISGVWQTPEGLVYEIAQLGNFVTVQEFNPLFGLTAVFEGIVEGNQVSGSFEATSGGFGTGLFRISSDGNRIDATFTDPLFGISSSVVMFRQ